LAEKLRIIPLGGLDEIGKNITVLEYGKDMIVVDCGVGFPDDDMYGVDLVIPDFSYLVANQKKLRGMFITHGHEDHIGSIPYCMKQVNCPIHGTAMTNGLIKLKLEEHHLADSVKLITHKPGDVVKAGCFTVEFIHVNHSIADAVAFAIKTPVGTVIMTGDFKIDPTSADGMMNLARLGQLGNEGVLALLADSTSRWAQAMREMSGRLEEIPGEEAFPAYLESVIASFYERAGKVRLKNGKIASVTIGGTVSPAGGNFEEPVTQATLKVVGAFHGLSRERSDARKYPAIHPIDSWSKYRGVVDMERVEQARSILKRSNEINQMMKVIGEEGTSAEDYIVYQKGELLDAVYLQQNSFDPIDAACDPDRQIHEFNVLYDVLTRDFALSDKKEIRAFFNQVRQEFLDWHNTVFRTPEFEAQEKRLKDFYLSKAAG